MEADFITVAALENIRAFLTCSLCDELFEEPKLMPCLHNFCLRCLEKMCDRESEGGDCVCCPLCSDPKRAVVQGGRALRCLKTNLAVQNLAEHLRKMDIVRSPRKLANAENASHTPDSVIIPCSICDRNESAMSLCTVCNEYLCPSCEVFHKVAKKTKRHTVVTLSREGVVVAGEEFTGLNHLPWKCDVHTDLFVDKYCRNCEEVVCSKCAGVAGHRHHYWDEASVLISECRQQIDGCVEATGALLQRFREKISAVESMQKSLKQRYDSTNDRVRKSFEEIMEKITAQRNDMLREAELIYQRESEALSEQFGTLEAIHNTLLASLAFTKQVFNDESVCLPTEALSLYVPALTRLEQLQLHYSTYELRANESSELLFVGNGLRDLSLSGIIGTLPSAPHPECFNANDINSTHFVNHKDACLTFTCRDLTGNILNSPQNPPTLHVTLQSCLQPDIVVTEMSSEVINGQYRIAIIPRTYGNHQLTVRAQYKDIQGSPFSIVVSPPLMEYATLVNCAHKETSGGLFSPAAVAALGNIVASSHGGSVLAFTRELQFTRFLLGEKDSLVSTQGIAFDSNRNLLVAEDNRHRIRVMVTTERQGDTLSCAHLTTRGFIEGFQYPMSIALSNDGHIFVCDAYRCVSYFTPEYTYLGQFGDSIRSGSDAHKDLCSITIDKEDRVLMSSNHLGKVCVFTRSRLEQSELNPFGYTLAWSFGESASPSKGLVGPCGIACDRQYGYIYVIERSSNNSCRLSVFGCNGDYITSYHAAGQVHFLQLRGICVCSDTHNIYLADYGRKQLLEVCLLDTL